MSVVYNEVELSHVLTQGIDQENVLEESGTDRLYTLFRVRVTALIFENSVTSLSGENPGETAQRIEHMLLAPRKRLVYSPNGVEVFNLDADDANGPKPIHCNVSMVAEGTWVVQWVCEIRLRQCGDDVPTWLTNRWTESQSYDETSWLATVRRSGTLTLSSRDPNGPDAWRGLVTPSVPAGFRRAQAEYSVTPDGLRVSYAFVDKQMVCPAPFPATRIRGRQVETIPRPGGVRYGEIQVRLDGPIGVDTQDLMRVGIRLAMARAIAARVMTFGSADRVLMSGSIEESLNDDENAVTIVLRWQGKSGKERIGGNTPSASERTGRFGSTFIKALINPFLPITSAFGSPNPPVPNAQGQNTAAAPFASSWVGQTLAGTDHTRAIGPPTRGLAEHIRLVAAALEDPCGSFAELRSGQDPNTLTAETPSGGSVAVSVSNQPGDDTPTLYDEDDGGVYTAYEIQSTYRDNPGVEVLPSTKARESARRVQLHNRSIRLTVEWTASRVGGPPEIPKPEPDDANIVYVGGSIGIQNLELAADGVTETHSVTGVYEYGFLDASRVHLTAPLPPFLISELRQQANQASAIVRGDLVFGPPGQPRNAFTGDGVTESGTQTVELRGGPPVRS